MSRGVRPDHNRDTDANTITTTLDAVDGDWFAPERDRLRSLFTRQRRSGNYPSPRRDLLAHLDAEHWVPGRLRRDANVAELARWHDYLHRKAAK